MPIGAWPGFGHEFPEPRPGYLGHFPGPACHATVPRMATTTTKKHHCMQCELTEEKCECEKYCCQCQGQLAIRLCEDGLYYCQPCREACDHHTEN
jgi:hypothetical protein